MPPRTRTSTRTRQIGIQSFARTTKPGTDTCTDTKVAVAGTKKEKFDPSTKTETRAEDAVSALPVTPSSSSKKKKRKFNSEEHDSTDDVATTTTTPTPSKTLRIGELSVSTPTPTPKTRRTDIINTTTATATAHTPPREISPPPSFTDLASLNSSFLKALTIHFAHNGASKPADLRELLHSVERIWKKRRVLVEDLRRLVWVWGQRSSSSFSFSAGADADAGVKGPFYRIANYGMGRVCLECSNGHGQAVGCIDVNGLQVEFEQVLKSLWLRRRRKDYYQDDENEKDEQDEDESEDEHDDFIQTLGLAPIHNSLTPLTSFRTGQLRLQDLKGGVIKMKTETLRAKAAGDDDDGSGSKNLDAPRDRRKGLLARIKNKELQQSKLPPPPSKAMLLRRAAAERVEDVVRVVALLRPTAAAVSVGDSGTDADAALFTTTGVMQRKPFRLETIIQHVQDSMRNPISSEEVEICLDILAQTDIAGQWVSIVTVKGIRSVVLKSSGDVSPTEIGKRVRQMRIGWEDSSMPGLEIPRRQLWV